MKAIESFVQKQNGVSIELSVFGFNTVARKLYESEGYETTRISMKKNLA
jgi:ribosomal protein S18 acetylase RimI-like enzyme